MRNPETEYARRLLRVGAVVLAAGAGLVFLLRSTSSPVPRDPTGAVDDADTVPVILLEDARIVEVNEELETAPMRLESFDGIDGLGVHGGAAEPQKIDIPVQKMELPPLAKWDAGTASAPAVPPQQP